MQIIPTLIIIFVVPVALNLLADSAKKVRTASINHFEMRPAKELSYVGIAGGAFFGMCIIGSYLGGELDGILAAGFGILFAFSIMLILAPVKGFWDAKVDGDTLSMTRLWCIKKSVSIKDISHCTRTKGGTHIYLKGKKKKAFSVDGMSTNLRNFEKRMEKEGIEILVK